MARITPTTAQFVQLEDFEPYRFTFKAWEWSTGSPEFGSKRRIQVTLAVNGEAEDTVLDWINCAINKQQGGSQPSKLTEFLNAFAGKPADSEIAWFDDESGEWGYTDDAAYARLNDLLEHDVIGRGRNKPRPNGEGTRYRIEHYQQAKKPVASNGGRGKPKPATAEVEVKDANSDDVPF